MRRSILSVVTFFAAAVLMIGALPRAAEAQSHAQLVWNQLNRHFETARGQGFGSRNYIIGRMDDDASDSWTVMLEGGRQYRIIGSCDGDCDDLDLEIFEGDRSVGRDVLVDDFPIVNFNAPSTSAYTIKVIMASCKANPCFFGFVVLYK